jgi:predicted nucleic acid-binding protein
MRGVVDTNVFVSAGIKENPPLAMVVHLAVVSHLLLKSTVTEQELFITLARPRLAPLIPLRFRD